MRREWLVKYRGDKTQCDVAAHCNIHRGHYSLIETGDRTPSVAVAKRIANYLGFDWTLFFEHNCVESKQMPA
ncbi:helix-turn-helix domain-containing protein [Alicyclobacillus fastidiosus]|uniref:Helix-turn-helix domain-containing protein n=1 Tax=Alicyclobacillus fastidiosus TaxID=392011 RepID=A0ABY6ZIT7_9BACL|nr:helix-turn-helix transcriptional regulator [Alicyclobacillus fastidiosus]WAH42797.1 helix-turn-helix domain-containing protein [Alicyclobacillus fastidiosus]